MRARRIFVDESLSEGVTVTLSEGASRHVSRVLRLETGGALTLFDGRGGEHESHIAGRAGRRLEVAVGRRTDIDRESSLPLRLALGVARGERMDYALQKGVELGASAFTPLATERTVVRLQEDRARRRAAHWRGVIVAACEQSGRTRVPVIDTMTPFPRWLAEREPAGLEVLLDPRNGCDVSSLRYPGGGMTLLVGPEGGLTGDEAEAARDAGFVPVRLGPRILRAETAAVTGLAVLQARWGDLDRS